MVDTVSPYVDIRWTHVWPHALQEDLEAVWEVIRVREFLQSFHLRSRWADLQQLDHLVHGCGRAADQYIHGAVETVSYTTAEAEALGLAA